MINEQEHIIARIKKMMALANDAGATLGERDNAMRMAYATMAKYNLEESDLSEKELREVLVYYGDSSPWARRVANSIAGLFFCKHYNCKGYKTFSHKFAGKAANALTAQMMTAYVIKSINTEVMKLARRDGHPSSWITDFRKGAANVIGTRCEELRRKQDNDTYESTGTGLVLASLYESELLANSAFLDSLGVQLKSSANREHRAGYEGFNSGTSFGKGLSLNNQVGGAKASQLRIGK